MATTSDPRASGFDAATFRDAIRFAMSMGMPNATEDKVTFRWNATSTYARQDNTSKPYSWESTALTTDAPADVQVLAAVEYRRALGAQSGTNVGLFNDADAIITLLDEEFAQVEGADQVLLGGDLYRIDYETKVALFDVDVVQIYASAYDES